MPHEVVVGALFGPTGDGRIFGYEPLTLPFGSKARTGIAQTPLASDRIHQWSPHRTMLTLRVEPVSGAAVLDTTPVVQEPSQRASRPGRRATESPDMGPARLGAW